MLDSIDAVGEYVRGLSLEGFQADRRTQRAVAFEVVIIGEAAKNVPSELRARHADLPWAQMAAVRNRAVHEYFRLSVPVLWDIATRDLPTLAVSLRAMLDSDDDASRSS